MTLLANDRVARERRQKRLELLATLFWRDDVEEPAALERDDREAIRVILRIALESDVAFRNVLRRKGSIDLTDELDYVCDSIQAGMDFFALVKEKGAIIRDVKTPRESGSLRHMMLKHGKYLRLLRDPKPGLPRRISLLLALVRINLIVFAHLW